jgi:predicted PolB exonuclease-like 3'-5' exonuclease
MLKFLHHTLCAFDAEWVPDVYAGRRRYALPPDMPPEEVVAAMYANAKDYHPETNPRPYLKTPLCRVGSVAVAWWKVGEDAVVHSWAGPHEEGTINAFLSMVGKRRPQLFSFNGRRADVPILLQRALTHGLELPQFAQRPNKPWEGVDYFDRYSGWHVDLLDSPLMEGGGSLADLCAGLGIPGKADMTGGDVYARWLSGDIEAIQHYNEEDAMRVLAVVARIGALMGQTPGVVPWAGAVLAAHPEWAQGGV